MVKNYSDRYSRHNFFTRFLMETKSGLMLIGINVLAFWYMNMSGFKTPDLQWIVLYPGNLARGYIWTIFTSGFLHRDWTHLFFNMLGILVFSRIVERQLGSWRTLFIYFGALTLSMLFSTIGYALAHQNVALIGASGAVMGLISAAMLLEPFCITYEMILPLPVMVKGWLFFYADLRGVLSNVNDGISHLAHVFGFASIAILVFFLSHKERGKMVAGLVVNIISLAAVIYLRRWIYSYL